MGYSVLAITDHEIYELYLQDGKVYIKCSDADSIICNYGVRRTEVFYNEGTPLTEAVFTVEKADKFFRITVTDKDGKRAVTNGYFTKDLFEE